MLHSDKHSILYDTVSAGEAERLFGLPPAQRHTLRAADGRARVLRCDDLLVLHRLGVREMIDNDVDRLHGKGPLLRLTEPDGGNVQIRGLFVVHAPKGRGFQEGIVESHNSIRD